MGIEVHLTSHGYPDYYPPNAYVLWIFQYAVGQDSTESVYQISFGYLYFGSDDFLRIGSGSDSNNSTGDLVSFGDYYSGYPDDFFLPAGDMFVEFDADSNSERQGFELWISVQNVSGTFKLRIFFCAVRNILFYI